MKSKQHFQIYFTIALILKPDKDTTRKENYKTVPLSGHRCKNSEQNTSKLNSSAHKWGSYTTIIQVVYP